MQSRYWNIHQPSLEVVRELSLHLDISTTLATVLANRALETPKKANSFLNPSLERLHDPSLMQDLDLAVEILKNAFSRRDPILVFGDYDVDGVTGVALLVEYFRRHTDRVAYYIPHRVQEGYGLQSERIRRFAAEGGKLVVTVDCGISHTAEVEEGRSLGLSFIITDHHEPPPVLPPAEAILNPLQKGCSYPFKQLAGVGIAFKLVQGLERAIGSGGEGGRDPTVSYLDLVALGTVADIVPVQDENRVFVKYGLELLNRPARPGIRALKKVSGLGARPMKTSHIAFTLGPRINAAGRLGRADTAVDLILEKKPEMAVFLAERLNEENRRRQLIEAQILKEAEEMVTGQQELLDDNILILSSPAWHSGVIGIVASKLAERYAKPSILISMESDPGKGSARSVPNFDLFTTLKKCQYLLEAFGGHSYAAGLSIRHDKIPLLRQAVNALEPPGGTASVNRPVLNIDARVDFGNLRPPLIAELELLMPFGYTNPSPVFVTDKVFISRPPRVVGNNHLRLTLSQKPHLRQAIGYNMGDLAASLSRHLAFNVAYSPELESWDRRSPGELRICDIQLPYSFEPVDVFI